MSEIQSLLCSTKKILSPRKYNEQQENLKQVSSICSFKFMGIVLSLVSSHKAPDRSSNTNIDPRPFLRLSGLLYNTNQLRSKPPSCDMQPLSTPNLLFHHFLSIFFTIFSTLITAMVATLISCVSTMFVQSWWQDWSRLRLPIMLYRPLPHHRQWQTAFLVIKI